MNAKITGGRMATLSDYTEPVSSTAVKWSQHDWQEHLQAPGRRLVELHALTENSFLLIGESLQDFYSRAGEVSAAADRISGDLLGPDASERLTRLQLMVERMSIFLAEIKKSSQHNEKSLQEICTALKRLKDPLKSFQKITKTLQVIGVTTRVECSDHVDSGSANGSVLSDSLRRLAALISGNMAAIVDQVALLHNLSEEALKNVIPASVKKIAVLDRTKEPGSIGEPLYLDVMVALKDRKDTTIIGGRYGLSSKEFNPSMVKAVYDHLDEECTHGFTVGIDDDVTNATIFAAGAARNKALIPDPHKMESIRNMWKSPNSHYQHFETGDVDRGHRQKDY